MNKSPNLPAREYSECTLDEKRELLKRLYHQDNMSIAQIAKKFDTYSQRILRDMKKAEIKTRDRSEAQALALKQNRTKHPTKGKVRSEEVKIKISESVAEEYESRSEEQKLEDRAKAKARWDAKSDKEIEEFRRAAGEGVRKAAKDGSALEKYILNGLLKAGYHIDFHKEHWISRERLQIDLFIPKLNIAIEVDGPSHFRNIWGEENLKKSQQRDSEKNGLMISSGCIIVRVRQSKPLSQKFKRDVLRDLIEVIKSIEKKRPTEGNRIIHIGK